MSSDIHFDFEALLVLLTVVTGVVTLMDRLLWRKQRQPEAREPIVVEYCRSFFPVILVVLLLRSFIVEPFRIPSRSMVPTLLDGDFILVNKFAYGLRAPVLHSKFLPIGEPERGDVVVFRYPETPEVDYIKRIIGMPGDVITYRLKQVYINGEAMPLELLPPYDSLEERGFQHLQEDLGTVKHNILRSGSAQLRGGPWVVPEGQYFVMGDNRDRSKDSRSWGYVPERNLVGKAFFIWMNWDPRLGRPDWSRIGDSID